MIISYSNVGMESARTYRSTSTEASFYKTSMADSFEGALNGLAKELDAKESEENKKDDDLSSGDKLKQDFDGIYNRLKTFVTSDDFSKKLERDAINKIMTQCIQYLIYMLFGKKPDDDLELTPVSNETTPNNSSSGEKIIYYATASSFERFEAESEETSFKSTGTVVTADGKEINFNLDLTMSRDFASYYENTVSRVSSFVDPLVINLDSNIANVSDVKIAFDIDADGNLDEISQLSSSSGYLSIDKNGDGIINDGNELFGTQTGNGFADLAKYDDDKNGWIDEADDIYNKLRICVFNEDGTQTLYKLKDKDVGAICLQNSDTEFSLNNLETNEANARIRRTGIFLYENGNVGTIQHLDLAQ